MICFVNYIINHKLKNSHHMNHDYLWKNSLRIGDNREI